MAKRKQVAPPKQEKMQGEGFARTDEQPEIEKAGQRVDELQTARMNLTKEETEARGALALALQTAKLAEYTLDSSKIARLSTTTKATVRKDKHADPNEEE